jgi:hypothetical protein
MFFPTINLSKIAALQGLGKVCRSGKTVVEAEYAAQALPPFSNSKILGGTMKKKGRSMTEHRHSKSRDAEAKKASGKLAGLQQNLLAERDALEEQMQQLQRRLKAISVLLEEDT